MRKKNLEFIFPLTALVILVLACSVQLFNAPPLGKLLDPFIGAVQNENDARLDARRLDLDGLGLQQGANVYFDDRKVPHIFAKNAADLYFTQGYVTASMRLWQMDFLTYVSAGRLCEIMTQVPLDYDRRQRRIGILDAAKASLKLIEKDPQTLAALDAYTKGVNAYISRLDYRNLPFEYKLLNYEPEPWTNLKTVLIMKHMANTLSGYEEDYLNTNLILALGEEKFNRLFPGIEPHITPIVKDSLKSNAGLAYNSKPDYLDYSFLSSGSTVTKSTYNPKLGSNSWAVSGKKTASGHPILCSDPHLNLSLPSIWFETQLSMPGTNVYGVSIPGVPAVIIGFNEHIAWGITAGIDDVKDWYKLKLTDDYAKYELDGRWIDLKYTVEEIRRHGQKPFFDTVYHTVQGPIVCDRSFPGTQPELMNHALRWELHNPSNDILTFIKLNSARNYADYKAALETFASPSQNFTFISKDNDISVDHRGRMAVKWPGQGKYILDGTNSGHLYKAYVPSDSLPHELNPACSYIVSANQRPTDASYPYYYNGYYTEKRAGRINSLLRDGSSFDIARMEAMQLDNTNEFAVESMPVLLAAVNKAALNGAAQSALQSLAAWKGRYDAGDRNAKLYELWWSNLRDDTWDEFKHYSFGVKMPDDYVLLDLIRKDPSNAYFDDGATTRKENAADIITQAFADASARYDREKKGTGGTWSDFNKVSVMHMTNIGPFSDLNLPCAGNPEAINATAPGFGPSWRMIVELGDRPRAFGVYPGGQSGNIGSASYDNFVHDWNKGNYYPLVLFLSEEEARKGTPCSWTLN